MQLRREQTQKLSQTQSYYMMQYMKIFAMPTFELLMYLKNQVQENPFLEEDDGINEEISNEVDNSNNNEEETKEVEIKDDKVEDIDIDWEKFFEENNQDTPIPNYSKSDDDHKNFENILKAEVNLLDSLLSQLHMLKLSPEETFVGELIIGNLNDSGFLEYSDHDILILAKSTIEKEKITNIDPDKITIDMIKNIRRRIQFFDPIGIASRNVKEALLIQLEYLGKKDSLEYIVVDKYFDELQHKKYNVICRNLDITMEELEEVENFIKILDPKPGVMFSKDKETEIIPDIIIEVVDDEIQIYLNDEGLPRLRINSYYKQLLKNKNKSIESSKDFLKQKLNSAVWLIKAIEQRKSTMLRIAQKIVEKQIDFFKKGPSHLKPMILKDIADEIGVHPTTVGRIVNSKYVQTPYGVFSLKYFFSSKIENEESGESHSSREIMLKIKEIIDNENKTKPLSDSKIAKLLSEKGYKVARRTVTKYREKLGILPSNLRKQIT